MTVEEIKKTLSLLHKPGELVELRVPKLKAGGNTAYGYYNDMDKLAADAAKYDRQAPGVYVTLNRLNPQLAARQELNKIVTVRGDATATSDNDIERRLWLPIDLDAKRPKDTSSDDRQHAAAIEKAPRVAAWLGDNGFPEPIVADSGNGGHLDYAVDLPNTPEITALLGRFMRALEYRYLCDDDGIGFDLTVVNPARVWKLYGTTSAKGVDTPGYPWRVSGVLSAPENPEIVPQDLIERIANLAPQTPQNSPNRNGAGVDPKAFISEHCLGRYKRKQWSGGDLYELETCPFDSAHKNSARIIKFSNGAIDFGCFHNGCAGKKWQELKEHLGIISSGEKQMPVQQRPAMCSPVSSKPAQGEQAVTDAAMKILNDDDPMKYLVDQVGRMHIGDAGAAKIVILSLLVQNVRNARGFHPGLHGKSGKGKTDLCKAVKHISPVGAVLETSLSGKALFYAGMTDGIVVMCDDIDLTDELRTTLKRATTNFTELTLHMTVDRGNGKTLAIPARVIWWFTSVDSDDDEQVLNREIPLPVDETTGMDDAVFQHQIDLLQSGAPAMPEDQDIEVAREMISILKSEMCTVVVPYADRIAWGNKDNRRNFDVFGDLLKAITLLHKYKRNPVLKDGETTITATVDDFEMAAKIYNPYGGAQATKLTNVEKDVVRYLASRAQTKKERYGAALFNEIQQHLGVSKGRTHDILHGRDGKGGLLAKVPGLFYEKESETEFDKALTKTVVGEGVYEREVEREVKTGSRTKARNRYVLDTHRYDAFKDYSKVAYLRDERARA